MPTTIAIMRQAEQAIQLYRKPTEDDNVDYLEAQCGTFRGSAALSFHTRNRQGPPPRGEAGRSFAKSSDRRQDDN
jgi:hypothetical protein